MKLLLPAFMFPWVLISKEDSVLTTKCLSEPVVQTRAAWCK